MGKDILILTQDEVAELTKAEVTHEANGNLSEDSELSMKELLKLEDVEFVYPESSGGREDRVVVVNGYAFYVLPDGSRNYIGTERRWVNNLWKLSNEACGRGMGLDDYLQDNLDAVERLAQ